MYLPINSAYRPILLLLLSCYPLFLFAGAQGPITHPSEAQALADIKEALIDINNNLSNWKIGDPCTSNWTGIKCYNETLPDGYLHVSDLQLFGLNLSGYLSPEIGRLSHLKILDFMWNTITGNIPKEIGNISSLELLLLNRNQLSGSLPEELGYLTKLNRIQIDENHISGPIPKSFANLTAALHFHMNNNSISGEIPREMSTLPKLVHFLLDNNNLSGHLPPELSAMPSLKILQLDNNNFGGSTIPDSYGRMTMLLKLSLRNCSLQGQIPDLSGIRELSYIDLSLNKLNGSIPQNKLSQNITTIILSNNELTGPIPTNLSGLPLLQKLSMENNMLTGSIPSGIWQSRPSNNFDNIFVNLQNNQLSNISGSINLPLNVTLWLQGNPACSDPSLSEFCLSENVISSNGSNALTGACLTTLCPPPYDCSSISCPSRCVCAAPLIVGYRLKSPGFSDFISYQRKFNHYLTSGLAVNLEQLLVSSFWWEEGPRLGMSLKIFPANDNNDSFEFSLTEIQRIMYMFTAWKIRDNATFGPYEVTSFTLLDNYKDVLVTTSSSMSKGELAGIIVGAIAGAVILSAIVSLLIVRAYMRKHQIFSRRRPSSTSSVKIEGVKKFTYGEMALATNSFDSSALVGQGGYGKVYRGMLKDGSVVAIKRAQEGSLQGEKEFLTEIQLLSRLHHRNLVSLIGYCDEEGEQMLVYEFMSNGTLRDHLSVNSKDPLSFTMRLRIALASAKGILYLHTEADPPIFHRDIKASNILLDSKFTAKVADFGLSRLASMPDIEGSAPAPVSTVVKGTPGYLDPEYFLTQKLTYKSDVYSFGVVLLELLTGMHPISHGKNIVREVKRMYGSGKIFSVIDGRMGSYPSEVVERFVSLALRCCQDESEGRPSMAEVVRVLESICVTAPEPDLRSSESPASGTRKVSTPPSSSSSLVRSFYVSTDVSGSELVSGAVPTITPR